MGQKLERAILKRALTLTPEFRAMAAVGVPVLTLFNNPNTSLRDLAKLVSTYPDLAARVLKIANSGYYGLRRTVDSVERAVILLGWNAVKLIALGSTLLTRMSDRNQRLAEHSQRTAVIARFIAEEAGFYKVEEIAVVGLLHDIGSIMLESLFPESATEARQYAHDWKLPLYLAEREIIGVDHGVVGGWALEEWNLPKNITSSVMWHHEFRPRTYHARKTAVIHLADMLAFATDVTGPSWEKVPPLAEGTLAALGFTELDIRGMAQTIMRLRFDPLVL